MWIVHKKYKQPDAQSFMGVVDVLYPKRKKGETASELIFKVIRGLSYNNYSIFVEFIKGLSNGNG